MDGRQLEALSRDEAEKVHAAVVVQSPSSVVKELLENAVDAGAGIVTLRLSGDLTRIEVDDNGSGIAETDSLAAAGYSSRCSDPSSLRASCYGFRGQALSAIATQASSVVVTTRVSITQPSEAPVYQNWEYDVTTGKKTRLQDKEGRSSRGTRVVVTDPFGRVPVRVKFWRDGQRIRRQWLLLVQQVMAVHLVHPHLHIMLFKNHSRVARAHGKPASTLDQSVKAVLGRAVFAALDCMDAADAKGRRMTVYLPKVGAAGLPATRSESDRFFVFINKRLVRWRSGAAAIRASWAVVKSSSHRDRDPVCVLVATIPAKEVDVNVCPQKSEVFLDNEKEALDLLATCLSKQPDLPADGESPAAEAEDQGREPSPASQLFLLRTGGISAVDQHQGTPEVDRAKSLASSQGGEDAPPPAVEDATAAPPPPAPPPPPPLSEELEQQSAALAAAPDDDSLFDFEDRGVAAGAPPAGVPPQAAEGSQPFFAAAPRRPPASRQSSASYATAASQREPSSEPAAGSRGDGAAAAAAQGPPAAAAAGVREAGPAEGSQPFFSAFQMPAGRAPASRPSSVSHVTAASQREDSSEPTAAAAVAAPFGAQTPPNGAQAQGPPAAAAPAAAPAAAAPAAAAAAAPAPAAAPAAAAPAPAAAAPAAAAGAGEAEPAEGSQPFFSAFQMPAGRAPASRPSSASDVAAVSQREDSSEPTAAAAVAAPPRPFGAQTPPNGAQAQGPPAAAAAAAAAAGAREAEPVEGSQPFFSAFQLPRAGRAPASRQSSASHATAAPQREPSSEPAANSRGSGAAAAAVVAPAARMPSGTNGQRSPSNNSAAAPSAGASRHSATRGPAANRNGAAAVVAPPAPAPRSRGPPAAAAAARTNDGHPDPSNSPAAAPPGASLRPSADAAGGSSQQNSGGRPPPPQAGTAAPTPQGTPAEYLDADEDEESLGFGSDGTSEEVIAVQRPAGMPATRLEDMLSTPVAVGVGGSQAGKRKRAEESSPATGKQAKLDPPPGGVRAALQVRDEGDLVSRLSRLVFPVNGQPAITHASLHPDQPLKPAVLDTPRRWPVGLAPRLHATQVTLVGKLKRTHWALLSVGRKRGVREFNDAADQLVAVDLRRLHASAAFAHLSASCAIPCTPVDGCSAGVELPQDGDDPFDETRLAALEQFASSPLVHENGFRVRWGEDGLLRITHMHDGGVVPGYGLRDLWHVAGKLAALRMSGGAAGILADFRSPAAEAAFRERAAREAEQLYPGGDADAAAESAQQTLKLALEAGLDFDEPSGLTLCEFS